MLKGNGEVSNGDGETSKNEGKALKAEKVLKVMQMHLSLMERR